MQTQRSSRKSRTAGLRVSCFPAEITWSASMIASVLRRSCSHSAARQRSVQAHMWRVICIRRLTPLYIGLHVTGAREDARSTTADHDAPSVRRGPATASMTIIIIYNSIIQRISACLLDHPPRPHPTVTCFRLTSGPTTGGAFHAEFSTV